MDDILSLFAEPFVEIIRPDRDDQGAGRLPPCVCCGRPAVMDDDSCGICEECLSV